MTFFLLAFFVIYLELLGQCVLYAIGVALCWLGLRALDRLFVRLRVRHLIHRSRTRGEWLIIYDERRPSAQLKNTSLDRS